MDEKVLLHVEGMDCANCAVTITKTLSKEGLKEVKVDFLSGEVTFDKKDNKEINSAVSTIQRLGYKVKNPNIGEEPVVEKSIIGESNTKQKFFISLVFTLPLFFHMFLPFSFLHNPVVQLLLCLPVMYIGFTHFGKSAYYSIRAGVPNMDVLIFIGSTSAFIYSIFGLISFYGTETVNTYLFFETAATIITLVLLGNLIEQRSVKQTTTAIKQLGMLQPPFAKKIIIKGLEEEIVKCEAKELQKGDLILINTGDSIPTDGKIQSGKGTFNESMLTGESQPVYKTVGDPVTGGTILEDGNIRFIVEKTGNETLLARIIELVKAAQHSKPEIQKLGDKISAIFVPVVLLISVCTFVFYYFFTDVLLSRALMNSIAVLVISCPCAMGLATPTAVMVGLGRAAKNGILIKGGTTIESMSGIKTVVFDKTGTLTTGNFKIKKINCIEGDENTIRQVLYSLEKNSSHPIARSVQTELKSYSSSAFEWKQIQEDKGIGINGTDSNGNLYSAGSFQMVKHFHPDAEHEIYLLKNNKLIATIDMEDEVKKGVKEVVEELQKSGMRVVLLSGDRKKNCENVASQTGISEIYSEKLPEEKLAILDRLMKENPTAMVGDGINDSPALAKATVGISISDASDTAIQSSQVILLAGNNLDNLTKAIALSRMTFQTIKQNLFWAFFYNVIAIPIAAAGFLNPMIGALSMAFSDVFVIGNSLRLRKRKIK